MTTAYCLYKFAPVINEKHIIPSAMNKQNEAKLNMYTAVASHSNANPAIIAEVPAFQAAITTLNANVASILTIAQFETKVITGISTDKALFKEKLAQQAAAIAAAVFAYASSVSNHTLKEQVRFSQRKLLRIKDELVAPTCLNIHNAASANLVSLAPYGITAATLTSFNSAITNYKANVPSPRNAISLRSAYVKDLHNLFSQTDKLIKEQLDKLSLQFQTSHTEFYNAYKSNRIIVDPGVSGTLIKGKVISAANNKSIKDVKVEVISNGLTDSSTATGRFLLKPHVAGTYSIKLSKAGFQENTINNIIVKTGQPSDVGTVMLTPEI